MKTIKELFEVYKPKSPDEQKFVDKHVTIKHKDRNGNDDDVFNATNVKTIKRKEERHGYDSGEDEKVYEEVEEIEETNRENKIKKNMITGKLGKDRAAAKGSAFYSDAKREGRKVLRGTAKKLRNEEVELEEGEVLDTDLTFFEELLEMNLDEDTFTDASLAQLRVMKHKQEMKKIESSSKLHPLMKVRKLSDAKKKLAELEADRDHYVAKHEKAQAKKKKVAEEVEELEEAAMKFDALKNLSKGGETYGKAFERHGDNLHKVMSDVRKERDHNMKHFGYKAGMLHDQAFKAYRAWKANRNTQNESVELEEKTLTPAEMKKREEVVRAVKRENPGMDKSMAYAIATKTAKRVAEEVEELDELSVKKLTDYMAGASDARRHRDMPVDKLDKRYKSVMRAGDKINKGFSKVHATEEVDLDEGLMHDRYIRSHGKKARGTGAWAFTTKQYGSPKENEMHFTSGQKSLSDAHKEAAAKLGTKYLYVMEDIEQINELSKKTLGSYAVKASRDAGSNLAGAVAGGMSPGSNTDDVKKMSRTYAKRMQGVEKAVNKLTKEDIINRAIENYMPEEYVTPSLDEQFIAKIDHLSEAHAVTLLALFDSLNEENKKTMLETVDYQEGINSLLDFAIKNRGD